MKINSDGSIVVSEVFHETIFAVYHPAAARPDAAIKLDRLPRFSTTIKESIAASIRRRPSSAFSTRLLIDGFSLVARGQRLADRNGYPLLIGSVDDEDGPNADPRGRFIEMGDHDGTVEN